jgi:ABC-type nitrate/sulfonate/bicarbonate transport system substrate-binding protein
MISSGRTRSILEIVTVALVATATALTAACSTSGGATAGSGGGATTIRLASVTSFDLGDAAVFDSATWDGSGVTVQRITATSPTADPLLASGGADIVVQSSNKAVADIAKGLPATIVATSSLDWGQNVVAKPNVGDISQLKGKTFGISGFGSGGYYATLKLAEHFGWAHSDYKVAQFGGLPQLTAALKTGAIDAFLWNPQQAAQLQSEGIAKDLGSVDPYITAAGTVFSVSNKLLSAHPAAVKTFFTAYYKQVAKIRADPTLALNLAVAKKQNRSAVESIYKEIVGKMSIDGSIPAKNLQGMSDAAKLSDTSLKTIDMTKVYKYWRTIS